LVWLLVVGVLWLALAAVLALVIARAIHVADEMEGSRPTSSSSRWTSTSRRTTVELAPAADDALPSKPRSAAAGTKPSHGRRSVVRDPAAASEGDPLREAG
jgi:hypothetical protein